MIKCAAENYTTLVCDLENKSLLKDRTLVCGGLGALFEGWAKELAGRNLDDRQKKWNVLRYIDRKRV